VISTVC